MFDGLRSPFSPAEAFLDGSDPQPIDGDEGVLTPRVRFTLWVSLSNIYYDISDSLETGQLEASVFYDEFPQIIKNQPEQWWREMARSAGRLVEASRRGVITELVPRTIAEEAVIAVAAQNDYVAWANNLIRTELQQEFDALPVKVGEDDCWNEILDILTGDSDVMIVWEHDYEQVARPDSVSSLQLGRGDYRPEAWHRPFLRRESELEPPDDI